MKIGKFDITKSEKTFFIADIAANHDGQLSRAIELIKKAAEAGADAAKFQNFKANTIVSDFGTPWTPLCVPQQRIASRVMG